MNHKRIPLVAALPLSLLAAGFAFGQTTPQSMSNQTSRHAQTSRNQAGVGAPPGTTRRAPPSFDQLAGNANYISRTGADQYTWLAQHFDQCDNDNNGKISRVEYRSCTGQTTGTSNMQSGQSTRSGQSIRQQSSGQRSSRQQSSGAFGALAGSKGYVSQREASQASWINRHFQQCDENHDGKVNRAEYRQCHARQGMRGSHMQGSNMQGSNMRGSNM